MVERMKTALAGLLAVALLIAGPAWGHDDDDDDHEGGGRHGHDRARARVLAGEILPLSAIVARAEREFGAEMIEAELEGHHGRPVYELKLLSRDGRLLKVYYDAGDGALIKTREKR